MDHISRPSPQTVEIIGQITYKRWLMEDIQNSDTQVLPPGGYLAPSEMCRNCLGSPPHHQHDNMTLAFLGDRESQPKPLFATVIGVGVTRSKGSCHYHSSISNRSTSVSMRFWITSYIDCIQYSHEKNPAFRTWKDVSPFYLLR